MNRAFRLIHAVFWSMMTLTLFDFSSRAQDLTGPSAALQTLPAERMLTILNQPVADYAAREAAAPSDVRARLEALRSQLREQGADFSVGYTTAFDVPLSMLAATRIPELPPGTFELVNARAQELVRIDIQSARDAKVSPRALLCSPNASKFDWRQHNKVNPVRAQVCGTCWDFTALGAYEGSYALRNAAQIVASPQHVLNCAHAGDCTGGWWMPVFDFLIKTGTATEADDKFTGNDKQSCPPVLATPYRASSWGFVSNAQWAIPRPQDIKQALCTHGPLATAVETDPAFVAYTGGPNGDQVFNEPKIHLTTQQINHGVVIIGWDDSKQAWLVQNSWGPGWGTTAGYGNEKGYMWIAYTTNNIGIATAWVDATNAAYTLNPQWFNTLEKFNVDAQPLPKAN